MSPNTTVVEEPCVPETTSQMEPSFVWLTLALCLLSRACSVFPMAALANLCRSRSHEIKLNEQAVIWFSGLRGAIALALAVEFPTAELVRGTSGQGAFCHQREHVVACTIVVVLCTVFVMGGFTKPVLELCGIPMGMGRDISREPTRGRSAADLSSKRWWKQAILNAERTYIRPVLIANYEQQAQAQEAVEARRESCSHREEGTGDEATSAGMESAAASTARL
mmetsp:Transcript_43409/g.114070  ORF Transcript_43409/g.114070 Transcript_43409/m.114070 type:complete len:223 (-) Transcript_43409:141-809(-)